MRASDRPLAAAAAPPLRARPFDLLLATFYVLFAIGWLLSDLPKSLGIATTINHYYAQTIDPLFADLPRALDAIMKVAGLVYGPCYVAVVVALVGGRPWLPRLGVPLAIAMELTTLAYLAGDLLGPLPPRNVPAFLALNGPYAVLPLALLYRCARRPS